MLRILLLFWAALSLPALAQEELYRLGPGDVIAIHVYGEQDLSFQRVLIGETGQISYPFLGVVDASNATLEEVEQRLIAGLKPDYLMDPKIVVSIVEYRPFYVSGEVKKPGSFPFQPGLTLLKAVSVAGGFTERASQSKIYVISQSDGSGTPRRVELDYLVRPGDTITVEESFF